MLRSGFGPGLLRVVGGYHEGVGNAIIDLHLTYPAPVTVVSTVSLGPKLDPRRGRARDSSQHRRRALWPLLRSPGRLQLRRRSDHEKLRALSWRQQRRRRLWRARSSAAQLSLHDSRSMPAARTDSLSGQQGAERRRREL